MRKPSRKSLVRVCDREMSLFVRERDKRCVICGSTRNLTCGHLMSRVAYSTRWSFDNCFTQCSGCNFLHEHNPHPFVAWFVHTFGWEKYEELMARHNKAVKLSNSDLQEILLNIRARRVA